MLGHRPLVLDDYLAMLKRRAWLILTPVLVLPIIGYAVSYTISPQYRSQTLVLIEGQKVPEGYVKPVIASDLDSRLDSIKEQLFSRSRMQPIVERYNLYPSSRYTIDDRIEMVRKDIAIVPIQSHISSSAVLPGFTVSFKASDAHTAQLVCADITSLFVGENQRSRGDSAQGTTDFLKSQLDEAKRGLDDQDAKLAEFQRKYMGRLPGEESPNVNMLTSLNTQLEAATQALQRMEQDRSYQESMLTQQVATQATLAPGSTGAAAASPSSLQTELQILLAQEADLTSHYTNDYPDVIAVRRKIGDVRHQIAQAPPPSVGPVSSTAPSRFDSPAVVQMRAQMRSADLGILQKRREQAQVQAQIHSYQDKIESTPAIAAEYKQLTRDYQTTLDEYNDLKGKMNSAKMATDLEKRAQGEQFRVMDDANLPDAPFSPNRPIFAVGGLVFGLALGIGLAALLEYRNTAVRSERDIYAFTKLPTLGVIAFSDVGLNPISRWSRLWSLIRWRRKAAPASASA